MEEIPLYAWSKVAIKKIIAKWGNIVHMEDDLGENVYMNLLWHINLLWAFQFYDLGWIFMYLKDDFAEFFHQLDESFTWLHGVSTRFLFPLLLFQPKCSKDTLTNDYVKIHDSDKHNYWY